MHEMKLQPSEIGNLYYFEYYYYIERLVDKLKKQKEESDRQQKEQAEKQSQYKAPKYTKPKVPSYKAPKF